MIQSHAKSGGPQEIAVPGGATINNVENIGLQRFSGWRD
jgi:hypothetical protein